MKKLTSFLFVVLAVVTILSYQNCGSSKFSGSGGSVTKSSMQGGNGGGYDGKPYIISDPTKICRDGDRSVSRIVHAQSAYLLVRKDCVDLEVPLVVKVDELEYESAGDSISYDKRIFDNEANLIAGTQLPSRGFCKAKNVSANLTGFTQSSPSTNYSLFTIFQMSGARLVATIILADNNSSVDYITSLFDVGTATASGPLTLRYTPVPNAGANLAMDFSVNPSTIAIDNVEFANDERATDRGLASNLDTDYESCLWN